MSRPEVKQVVIADEELGLDKLNDVSVDEKGTSSTTPTELPPDVPDLTIAYNWSLPKKVYNMSIPSLLCFIM